MPERTALREVFAFTREQRCWVHKTMNVLDTLPQSVRAGAKGLLHDSGRQGPALKPRPPSIFSPQPAA
jgi:hypothetical protein